MHAGTIKKLLEETRTIAVLGANDREGRPVDRVGRYLLEVGYRVLPVHPVRRSVWGLPCFPSLAAIGEPVDLVDVFRAPEFCAAHAREALELSPRPRLFWMQLGIISDEAAAILSSAGMPFVQDACLMVEHQRLFGTHRENG